MNFLKKKDADDSKNKKIDKTHPEFELTYDMMLGIRTCVGSIGAVPSVLTGDDFQDGEKALFKGRPNGREKIKTPPHQMRDFKFKDYAPKVFFSIRKLYNIDTADYMLTLAGNFQYLEFISNSKGGSFFFILMIRNL